jgi:hypothetical protein
VTASENEGTLRRDGWFVTAAGRIGDLGHPFYDEERQRDVWNEASAVGLQLMLWLSLAAATAMVWLGGALALPYAVPVLVVVGAVAGVTVLYARQLGVRIEDVRGVLRLRLVPYAVLLVALLAGLVRVAPPGGFADGFARGMVIGSVGAVLWMIVSGIRARRRERPDEV